MKMMTGPVTTGCGGGCAATADVKKIETNIQFDMAGPDLSVGQRGAAMNCEYSQVCLASTLDNLRAETGICGSRLSLRSSH
jgi:hypothetical protein